MSPTDPQAELAFVDDLTNLWNRRHAARFLASRSGESLSVVLIDLDGFKEVNDSRGHAAGDDVLRVVADVLRRTFRESDEIIRYGGDEFLVILPGTDPAVAERMIREVRSEVEHATSEFGRVSLSAGIAAMPRDGAGAEEILRAADDRLYAEKRTKRPSPARRVFLLAAAGAILIALTAWITARLSAPAPPQALAEQRRTGVAVLGFQNLSGRKEVEWLSTAFAEMLSHELSAAERLRVVPGETVARSRIDLALPAVDSLAPDTLARVGTSLNTDVVVLGSFLEVPGADSRIRLNVRLQDTRRGETLAVLSQDGSSQELVDLVARTGAALRQRLGAPPPGRAALATAQAAMPASLDATRFYAEGLERIRAFDALGARARFQDAIAADPSSPLVHAALAEAWGILGYDLEARKAAEEAFRLSDRLSREERLLVEGRFREAARDWNTAESLYRRLFQFAPDSIEYGLALARAQRQGGRMREATATLETLRRLPPPASGDPRIDLAVAEASTDHHVTLEAARSAIRKAEPRGSRLLIARARLIEAFALGELARYEEATRAAKEAERIYSEAGDRGGLARALNRIANVRPEQAGLEETRELYERALAIARDIGDRRWTGQVLNNLALTYSDSGDLARPRAMYEEALKIFREIDYRRGQANVLLNMGRDLNSQGRSNEARKFLRASEQIWRGIGDRGSLTYALNNLGNAAQNLGEVDEAWRLYSESFPISREVGDRRIEAYTLLDFGEIEAIRGRLAESRRHHEQALAIREEIGVKLDAAESRLALARIALMEGNPKRAEAETRPLIAFFAAQKTVQNETWARVILAHALHVQGRHKEAREAVAPVLSKAKSMQHAAVRLGVQILEARLLAAEDRTEEALRRLDAAIREAQELDMKNEEYESRLALAESHLAAGDRRSAVAVAELLRKDAGPTQFGLIARRAEAIAR